MLANVANIPFDEDSFFEWSFSNQDEHLKIADSILRKTGTSIQRYILDPIPLNNPGVWLYNHQAAHNVQNGILGITGNDLTSVDFNSPEQVADFVWLHFTEHYQAAQKLGLT